MHKNHEPVRVGIAGLGRSGWGIHGDACESLAPRYQVVAVSDPRPERRAEAEQRFGCRSYAEAEDLIADKEMDLVVVATPSHLHVEHALAAIQAGHNVLVEKPFALSTQEADHVIAASKAAGRLLAPFQNLRYDPTFRQVQAVIDSGRLGRIVQVRMAAHNFTRRWDWQTLKRFGGGTLNNTGPHLIDQALQLFGEGEPEVFCQLDCTLTSGDADDHVKLALHGPGAPMIEVEITACCAYRQDNWLVMGTRGGLRGTSTELAWKWVDFDRLPDRPVETEPSPDRSYNREQLEWHEESWRRPEGGRELTVHPFYEDLYRTLREGAPLAVTPESVRRQIAVLETCHTSCPL